VLPCGYGRGCPFLLRTGVTQPDAHRAAHPAWGRAGASRLWLPTGLAEILSHLVEARVHAPAMTTSESAIELLREAVEVEDSLGIHGASTV